MSLIDLFHGGGRRRRSDENWLELERRASDAESRAKHMDGAYRYECQAPDPARRHPAMWVYSKNRVPCPWCEIGALKQALEIAARANAALDKQYELAEADRQRLATLLDADAGVPGTEPVPAPIEQGCRDTPASNADTQAVDVSSLRDAIGEGDTAVIPVVPEAPVALDKLPPVTWGVKTGDAKALKEWATAPGALPGAGPADIPNTAGLNAVTRVLATVPSTD